MCAMHVALDRRVFRAGGHGPLAALAHAWVAARYCSRVSGFAEFIASTKLQEPVVGQLFADVVAAGAVDVSELGPLDWPQLPSWQNLRPLEVRRVLAAVAGP